MWLFLLLRKEDEQSLYSPLLRLSKSPFSKGGPRGIISASLLFYRSNELPIKAHLSFSTPVRYLSPDVCGLNDALCY